MISDSMIEKSRTKVTVAAVGLSLASTMLFAAPASAQSTHRTRRESNANRKVRIARTIEQTYGHRWEVGGGGGYLRNRSGEFKLHDNEVTYWASALYSLSPTFGIVGSTGGDFGSAQLGNNLRNAINPQIQKYTFLAGPSYRFVRREHYSVSGYVTGGAAWGRFSTGPKDFPPETPGIDLYPSGVRPAFSVGANFDYNLFPNLGVRITPNYLGTTFGGSLQNNKGVNAGIVYRFGGTK